MASQFILKLDTNLVFVSCGNLQVAYNGDAKLFW